MAKKRIKKQRSVTPKRHDTAHDKYALQCLFCFGEMRMSKRRMRGGGLVITFRCTCGAKLEAVFEPDDYIGSFSDS